MQNRCKSLTWNPMSKRQATMDSVICPSTRAQSNWYGAGCERQRRSAPKPRVGAQRLPWDHGCHVATNPNGVAPSGWVRRGRNPVGVRWDRAQRTQGRRSCLAPTLGFEAERRWRSQSLATVLRTDRRTRSLDPTPADVSISAPAAHAIGPAWVSSALGGARSPSYEKHEQMSEVWVERCHRRCQGD